MLRSYFLVLVGTLLCLPGLSHAAEVLNLPLGAVGLTEATYAELKDGHCYYPEYAPDDAVQVSDGGYCDAIVARFYGQIVFRAEHFGEMYQINTGDGAPTLMRYLLDGFYKANKKYFWVADNQRVRIKANNFYTRILLTAQAHPASVVPISHDDFFAMLTTCEGPYEGIPFDAAAHEECLARIEQGNALYYRLARQVVLDVQNTGALYYIPQNSGLGPQLLPDMTFTSVKEFAAPVKLHVIKKLYPNNDWQ